ncbi:50S ribosomal protein L35ae [Candidatus Woesearchaeota archaeon]|nr:50S ribosomal protein L35ae [Candidatus Woesearchaeota archaeon]
MKGIVLNYRGSHKQQNPRQMLVKVEGVDTKEGATKLKNKKVVWTCSSGKKITGIITQPHGNKGVVRVHFREKGLPGQALGDKVDIE